LKAMQPTRRSGLLAVKKNIPLAVTPCKLRSARAEPAEKDGNPF
jgi:hypothetical protein